VLLVPSWDGASGDLGRSRDGASGGDRDVDCDRGCLLRALTRRLLDAARAQADAGDGADVRVWLEAAPPLVAPRGAVT